MNKEITLWRFIAKRLKLHQKVMLLIVTESSGSSPGRQGFKMAVGEDHLLCGSIGGGIMEVKLVELAKKMLKENISEPQIKKQIHRKNVGHHQSGMICSGEQTVIYFSLNESHLPEIRKIIRILCGYHFAVITISQDKNIPLFTVTSGIKNSATFAFEKSGDEAFEWKENIGFHQNLFIIGGGHCALALSELMSRLDFYIHVMDDRPGLNTMEKNHYAHKKHIVEKYENIRDVIPSGPDVYVVVMTLGYRSDLTVLLQLTEKSFGYVGLLGSATKVNALKEELIKNKVRKNFFKELHAPIGLKINSHTPEEIAVSIAAEIVKVKNGA